MTITLVRYNRLIIGRSVSDRVSLLCGYGINAIEDSEIVVRRMRRLASKDGITIKLLPWKVVAATWTATAEEVRALGPVLSTYTTATTYTEAA